MPAAGAAGLGTGGRLSAIAQALAPFETGQASGRGGALAWLLALAAGAFVIALLFLDSLGVGARHGYLRRRQRRLWRSPR